MPLQAPVLNLPKTPTATHRLLAKRLRLLRSLRGWSQETLAEQAGLHRTYISGIERAAALAHPGNCSLRCSTSRHPWRSPALRGIRTFCTSERNPGLDNLDKLAQAFDITVADLLMGDPMAASHPGGHNERRSISNPSHHHTMPASADTQVLTKTPREALRPFIKGLLVVESTAAHPDAHLPDTGLVAAFSFRGDCWLYGGPRAPRAAITGLWDTVRTHAHSRDHAVVIVGFTPIGAAALLRQPLEEFANATTDLDAVLGDPVGVDRLNDQVAEAADHGQRFRLVEDFLVARVGDTQPDSLVAAAVALIERTQGMVRIEELVRRIGLSHSALERRFRRRVGASPRRFASLVRLRNVVRLGEAGTDLTTIAHAAGYYDQSHFIKDFKQFTGQAPGSFFGSAAG